MVFQVIKQALRAVFPLMVLLLYCDMASPVMDGLYYYVQRTDETLSKSKEALNILDLKKMVAQLGKLKRASRDELKSSSDDEDGSNEVGAKSDESDESHDEDLTPSETMETSTTLEADDRLGGKLSKLWRRRRPDLVHPFAVAGYYLCPVPEVMEHRKQHGTGSDRLVVEKLLVKLMLPG